MIQSLNLTLNYLFYQPKYQPKKQSPVNISLQGFSAEKEGFEPPEV